MQGKIKLDVVVPTYNRSDLLSRAVDSLMRATVPAGTDICIYVVDNNSTDDTAQVVRQKQASAPLPLVYILETRQGSSAARNAGVRAGAGDILAFIDDDEEVDSQWFEVIAREFAVPQVLYIGGPCLANWVSPVPKWLPPGYHAVIGAIPPKPRAIIDNHFAGNLMSGNCALRRTVFEQVGMYDPHLGRSAKGLLSDEDAELFGRIRGAGLEGVYVPDFIIYHYIAPERLTKSYYRRWAYWRAVSQGSQARQQRESVPHLGSVPRYRIGRSLRGLLTYPFQRLRKASAGLAFSTELAICELAGFIYGRHFARMERFYASKTA